MVIPPPPRVLSEISVDTTGATTRFKSGADEFTSAGLVVKAVYSDTDKVTLTDSDYTVTGYEDYENEDGKLVRDADAADPQEVTITVTYQDKTKTYKIYIYTDEEKLPPEPDPEPEPPQDSGDYKPLPIIPEGNTYNTKVDSAGVFIYLDNKDLGISGGNAGTVIENIDVVVTDTVNNENISIQSKVFDDYGAGEATVRLNIVLSEAHPNIKVDITGTINGKKYKGEAVFVEDVYQFDFEPTAISLEPNETSVKPGAEVEFKVIATAPYEMDVTGKCTFVIEGADSVDSKMAGNKFTAGDSEGTVTVKATHKTSGLTATATVTISEDAADINWGSIEFIGDGAGGGSYANKYKVYGPGLEEIVNIQNPGWEDQTGPGIYVKSAVAIKTCSLGEDRSEYYIQGGGILLYLTTFESKVTEFTITDVNGKEIDCAVYYVDGEE